MSTFEVTFDEKDYASHVALKKAMGIDPADFKHLVTAVKDFIVENEPYFQKTARNRLWTNGEWKNMAENFTMNDSRGAQFFSKNRGGFISDEHPSWPAEKQE